MKYQNLRTVVTALTPAVALLLGSSGALLAQDCDLFALHGLRDFEYRKTIDEMHAAFHYSYCGSEFKEEEIVSEAEMAIFKKVFSGEASFSWRQTQLRAWCTEHESVANEYRYEEHELRTLNEQAISAWRECIRLKASSVEFEPQVTPSGNVFDCSVRSDVPVAEGLRFLGVFAKSFSCQTLIPSAQGVVEFDPKVTTRIGPEGLTIHCERNEPEQRIAEDGTVHTVWDEGSIAIHTAAGILQVPFAERWLPELPARIAEEIRAEIRELSANQESLIDNQDVFREDLDQIVGDLSELTQLTMIKPGEKCPAGMRGGGKISFLREGRSSDLPVGGHFGGPFWWHFAKLCVRD